VSLALSEERFVVDDSYPVSVHAFRRKKTPEQDGAKQATQPRSMGNSLQHCRGVLRRAVHRHLLLPGCSGMSPLLIHFAETQPVTPQNMNYVVVFAAFFSAVLAIIWYTYAKKRYTGPKVRAVYKWAIPLLTHRTSCLRSFCAMRSDRRVWYEKILYVSNRWIVHKTCIWSVQCCAVPKCI